MISSSEIRITCFVYHGLFSSCSAAFDKSFDVWTLILSSSLLITFARTTAFNFATNSTREKSYPMACSKVFPWERLSCFWLSDWRNFTVNLLLNSNGISGHYHALHMYCSCWNIKVVVKRSLHILYTYWFIVQCCSEKHWQFHKTLSVRLGIVRIEVLYQISDN